MSTLSTHLSPANRLRLLAQSRRQEALKKKPISLLPDPASWITSEFYIPETGRPIELYPSQITPLREALAIDAGIFRYSTVCWSAIKKSAKSTIAGAVALWMAMNQPFSTVRIVANSREQAASRSYEAITQAIALNPKWDKNWVKQYSIRLPNHSRIQAVPLNAKTQAGGGDDFTLYTELWGWTTQEAQKMWTEMTLSPLKFGRSMRWAETYAGYAGTSSVLEGLYKQGVTGGEVIDSEYEMYRNERLFCLWQTRPHLPWQTASYYAQEADSLASSEFNRVHRNQWQSGTEKFVSEAWWRACMVKGVPASSNRVVVAMDAAVSGDSFGMVAVTKISDKLADEQGINHKFMPIYARKWDPPKNGEISFAEVEAEFWRLVDRFQVLCLAYDPYQLADMSQRIERSGKVYVRKFGQGAPRLTADKALHDKIRDGYLIHSFDDTHPMSQHIDNADRKNEGDSKMRIIKRQKHLKVDLAVALSMACATAEAIGL